MNIGDLVTIVIGTAGATGSGTVIMTGTINSLSGISLGVKIARPIGDTYISAQPSRFSKTDNGWELRV